MDLELIGKQMLEALAAQGQVAAFETKIAELERQIAGAQVDIRRAESNKESQLEACSQAKDVLGKALGDAERAHEVSVAAKANLATTQGAVDEARKKVAKYDTAFLEQLNRVIGQCQEAKDDLEARKDEIAGELKAAQEDLKERQAKLASQGIELNLGGTRVQPKITVL